MGKQLAIPKVLGISWWWLLLLGAADAYLHRFFKLPLWVPSLDGLWFMAQGFWLKQAEPRSIAIYLYIAMMAFDVGTGLLPASWSNHWQLQLWSDASYVVMLVGIFVFRAEMKRHFQETDPRGIELSGVMTFFFSSLYFQYWFHQIYLEQHQDDLRLSVQGRQDSRFPRE